MQDILDRTKVSPDKVLAFLELHTEQGPLLEREAAQAGVKLIIVPSMVEL